MWSKYERGIAVPGGEVLMLFAMAGANVQFVLTGESSENVALSRDEQEIVEHYRTAPLAVKSAVLAALTAGTTAQQSAGTSQVFHGKVSGQIAGNKIVNHSVISNKKNK
ncbi:XRE family transcriptional regulator [Brenneria sp. KBI 423]|nr:XRE family transcriptional regulator [Brenneria izbisi]